MPRIRIQLTGVKELIIEIDDASLASAIAGLVSSEDEEEEDSTVILGADTVIQLNQQPPMFGFVPFGTNNAPWIYEDSLRHRGT